jgi:hypothetical protein
MDLRLIHIYVRVSVGFIFMSIHVTIGKVFLQWHNMLFTLLQPLLCIFRTFTIETMDLMASASGEENAPIPPPPVRPPERHRFKSVVTCEEWYGKHSGHSVRSPRANDGDTARPRVSIHVLQPNYISIT